jgi:hypothetical protein
MSGLWPNFDAVSSRVAECVEAAVNKQDFKKFQTTGTDIAVKKVRRASPNRTNQSFQNSTSSPARNQNFQPQPEQQRSPAHQVQAAASSASDGPDVKCGSHLKSPEDLTGYPTFPPGTSSMITKYLTRDIWNKYKDQKDNTDFSFKQAIFSGCQNTDSSIGVYAGSPDTYRAFSDFFDKIIEDYHGHKPTDRHISSMDASKLNAPPFEAHEAAMIKSTRIRVARNYADVRLGPGISKQDRLKLVDRFEQVAKGFTGDLAGKFYSLDTMSQADQNQLIEDHFLFKEGDRFLQACGLNRDWPSGRGIFHNNAKTFLVWINEEDELRIISMQNGANIGEVFERLCRAANMLENNAEFAQNEHLGYITSCPTNCGTGLRASVHIKLPNLGP